ncbi:GTPase-activating protein and VPS9 domain-containing protein 1 [Amphibalanus amphitrite]|uniref:Receptor-mediated endocytosis protein 6 homolog n=1 Tax=Amphibalanus amphitrite TaxID=1232801 RepID=A0A6A4W4G4_AMPAM|nr:GTPase-activating protein and VPS9 domain-containing protein 1 [Amphibalanus amphitrite]
MATPYKELLDLSQCLKREKLFVESEKAQIQDLNIKVMRAVEDLYHLSWITRQQQVNLEGLILSRGDSTPAGCCRRDTQLQAASFVDSYKQLGPIDPFYSELLQQLRSSPPLVARLLLYCEQSEPARVTQLVNTVYSGVFGNGILQEDGSCILQAIQVWCELTVVCYSAPPDVLRELMVTQVVNSEEPQRLLRRGSCVFSRVYKAFCEGLFEAKLFLTSALHQPTMQLIMDDEWYLDIDPNKVDEGLSAEERAARPVSGDGPPHSAVADRLARLTESFVSEITASAACFPASLAWVVRTLRELLAEAGRCSPDQLSAICVDLMFAFFICPAVVDPVQYGLLEAPVSPAARHNLIQVGQILQVLAMDQADQVDPRLRPFYDRFDKARMPALVSAVLAGGGGAEAGPAGPPERGSHLVGLSRSAVLVTRQHLDHLVTLVRGLAARSADPADKKLLEGLVAHLPSPEPPPPPPPPPPAAGAGHSPGTAPQGGQAGHGAGAQGGRRNRIMDKVHQRRARSIGGTAGAAQPAPSEESALEVLVVSLNTPGACPGMIPEQKVLRAGQQSDGGAVPPDAGDSGAPSEPDDRESLTSASAAVPETAEKRTRFSLSQELEGSIGNTSDILEVISEGASQLSASDDSSLEDAEQYKEDNLSDMISANVSGRETPNVSGRNTPSSQVTDETDAAVGGGGGRPGARAAPAPAPPPPKPPATVIEDKFGKFNIKPLNEDETVSMVSDTWSTDVLASDTETVEQAEAPLSSRQLLDLCTGSVGVDISETASEAWSTDVLASDSERDRLAEVDADDSVSVARSDDTARSEPAAAPGSPALKPSASAPAVAAAAAAAGVAGPAGGGPPRAERGRQMSGESVSSDFSSASGLQRERGRQAAAAAGSAGRAPASQSLPAPPPAAAAAPPSPPRSPTSAGAPPPLPAVEPCSSSSSCSEIAESAGVAAESAATAAESTVSEPAARPAAATGAIPKSISFDKTAERGDRRSTDDQARRGFFKSLKLPFAKNRRKGSRELVAERLERGSGDGREVTERRSAPPPVDSAETSDDILAKYRRKGSDPAAQRRPGGPAGPSETGAEEEPAADLVRLAIDPNNVEASYAFSDAKRKLRRVLSAANVQTFPWRPQAASGDQQCALLAFLRLQLSEYISLQDHALMAQLHETIRCVSLLDGAGRAALLRSLRDDYTGRSAYTAYLVRCRNGLLDTLAHLQLTAQHVRRDQAVCTRALVDKCVLLFLERHKNTLKRFKASFQQAAASDEKTDLVERFLTHLGDELLRDPDWQVADDKQLLLAREAIEQMVMAKIYTLALYPNGEADVSRDQVLTGHMRRLALVVTPSHPDLKIPSVYHYEQPWPSAQAEIVALNAYKTARDKVSCVTRCCAAIMNLLHMASERSVPAADDLIPVLVFVLIKACPSSLLSTIQYVGSFYGERLSGEDQYWWTQFCSAVEFIKTMDYN